jgi:hypothetical protein
MNNVAGKLATKTAASSATTVSGNVNVTATATTSMSKNSLNTVVEEAGEH